MDKGQDHSAIVNPFGTMSIHTSPAPGTAAKSADL